MTTLLLLLALPLCSFGPGLLVVRHGSWSRVEKLVAAAGVSLVLLYLLSFAAFWLGLPARPVALSLVAASAVAAWLARSEIRRVFAWRPSRRRLVAFAVVFAVVLSFCASIRTFSGGGWYRDWYEQYERSLVFLARSPEVQEVLEGGSPLTARPPLMNVVAAHFLALGDGSFVAYQVVACWLSALAFLGGALLITTWGRHDRERLAVFTCLLLLDPSFVQNATYPWTKLASAFFVLLGSALYLRGWRKNDPSRIVASALAFAAACLVHYSAVPYAIFVAGHYLVVLARRPRRRRGLEVAGSLLAASLLLGTWFVWSELAFGARETFTSNTTWVGTARKSLLGNERKIGHNLVNTLVPHPLRISRRDNEAFLGNAGSLGFVHDSSFLVYQHSALPAMGLVGGLVVTVLWLGAATGLRRPRSRLPGRRRAQRSIARFWSGWILVSLVLGIAAFPEPDLYGLVHIVLQPLVLAGLAFLAAELGGLPRWTRALVWLGAAFDAAVGIGLHFWAQAVDVAAFARAEGMAAAQRWGMLHAGSRATRNTALKLSHELAYLGDLQPLPRDLLLAALALALVVALGVLAHHTLRLRHPAARR